MAHVLLFDSPLYKITERQDLKSVDDSPLLGPCESSVKSGCHASQLYELLSTEGIIGPC